MTAVSPLLRRRRRVLQQYAELAERADYAMRNGRVVARRAHAALLDGEPPVPDLPDVLSELASAIGRLTVELTRDGDPVRARQPVLDVVGSEGLRPGGGARGSREGAGGAGARSHWTCAGDREGRDERGGRGESRRRRDGATRRWVIQAPHAALPIRPGGKRGTSSSGNLEQIDIAARTSVDAVVPPSPEAVTSPRPARSTARRRSREPAVLLPQQHGRPPRSVSAG